MRRKFEHIFENLSQNDHTSYVEDIYDLLEIKDDLLIKNVDALPLFVKTHFMRMAYVNAVSYFEIRLRELFIRIIDDFQFPYKNLKSNVSLQLKDLYLYESSNLTIGIVLAEFLNFQNLDSIQKVFGSLLSLNHSFLSELKKYFLKSSKLKSEDWATFIQDIESCIEKRHKIIHRGIKEIKLERFEYEISSLIDFPHVLRGWLISSTSVREYYIAYLENKYLEHFQFIGEMTSDIIKKWDTKNWQNGYVQYFLEDMENDHHKLLKNKIEYINSKEISITNEIATEITTIILGTQNHYIQRYLKKYEKAIDNIARLNNIDLEFFKFD
ncbi:MAG: hypothetical protein HeimC2_28360 [Candidatus Heimdallarchaeota archaeon LC_2]|nr:MAG: hypothetical protein HeimC2_28360 [Candidatus Heimdallarchaeota archaeon LC_2]